MTAQEQWATRQGLAAASARFRAEMPDLEPPAAYGVGAVSSDGAVDFPVVNVGAHGLPGLVLASVCGYRTGNATYPLSAEQLKSAITLLAPAEACPDWEHPNLTTWRMLDAHPGPTVAVFLADTSGATATPTDDPQRRLVELAQVRPLPTDLHGSDAGPVLDALDRATDRLVATAREHVHLLDEPSSLPGWTRVNVIAHLRYVAEAMHRMTKHALAGRPVEMYPGGRDIVRPRTLTLRERETPDKLVRSLARGAKQLSERWHSLSAADWARPVTDREFGEVALTRYLVLRLTEVEVHSTDLGLPGLDAWSDDFVRTVLPLRLALLGNARRRPDADQTRNGSWVLTDPDRETSWLVQAYGPDVEVGEVPPQRTSDGRISATPHDLLALLLGRPTTGTIDTVGLPELTHGFKAAFPGP